MENSHWSRMEWVLHGDFVKSSLSASQVAVLGVSLFLYVLIRRLVVSSAGSGPPALPDYLRLPIIGNTYQFLTDNAAFLARANSAFDDQGILQYRLGTMNVFLLSGAQNVRKIFCKTRAVNSNRFVMTVLKNMSGASKSDLAMVKSHSPVTSMAGSAHGRGYWEDRHSLFRNHLASIPGSTGVSDTYSSFLEQIIEEQVPRVGEWHDMEVGVSSWLKTHMARCVTAAIAGTRILEREPGLIDAIWNFDNMLLRMLYAAPAWVDPPPAKARERFRAMGVSFLVDEFDARPDASREFDGWDPVLGSRFFREQMQTLKRLNFSLPMRGGSLVGLLHGANGNTIPTTTWALFEVIRDAKLWHAVRQEVSHVLERDPETGKQRLNITALLSLPLLQSIFWETLRLHTSSTVIREVTADDCYVAGYLLPKHSVVQLPSLLGSQREDLWATPDHPASEFWAERHISYVAQADGQTRREFVMRARPSEFFPFGGGVPMCPGRHLARQEFSLTIALLVQRLDIEFVGWTWPDGKRVSDRPAQNETSLSGAAAMHPDRDMRVRWRRRW